jgi:hypothetical protein
VVSCWAILNQLLELGGGWWVMKEVRQGVGAGDSRDMSSVVFGGCILLLSQPVAQHTQAVTPADEVRFMVGCRYLIPLPTAP